MNEYLTVLLKSIGSFFVLLILTRLMGRKQLSQLTFFDYIVGITIGSIAANLITDPKVSTIQVTIALLIWTTLPILIGILSLKNIHLRRRIDGEPLIVIDNGKILTQNMAKAKYNIGDLLMQLREKDVFDLTEVEFAILEANGLLSILKKSQYQPVTPRDLNIPTQYKGLTTEIILNGQVIDEHLQMLNLDRIWLSEELRKQNIESIDSVVFAGLQSDGTLYIAMDK